MSRFADEKVVWVLVRFGEDRVECVAEFGGGAAITCYCLVVFGWHEAMAIVSALARLGFSGTTRSLSFTVWSRSLSAES